MQVTHIDKSPKFSRPSCDSELLLIGSSQFQRMLINQRLVYIHGRSGKLGTKSTQFSSSSSSNQKMERNTQQGIGQRVKNQKSRTIRIGKVNRRLKSN